MRIELEGTLEELEAKGPELLKSLATRLGVELLDLVHPEDVLHKAEHAGVELRHKALKQLHARERKVVEATYAAMLTDIDKLLASTLQKALILTPEQLEETKQIIQRHHAALILQLIGADALNRIESELLANTDTSPTIESIRDAYLYGQALAAAKATPETDYAVFKAWLVKNSPSLSRQEELAIQAAQSLAGEHIRHLGAKVQQVMGQLYFEEDEAARQAILRRVIRPEVAENIQKRQSIGALRAKVQDVLRDYTRDWNRVAITEKTNAMNRGVADKYRKDHGDPWVFKRPMDSACRHCLRLHLGPDGHPRIFRLSELEANGTNFGRKARAWKAIVPATHPNCQCVLSRLPDGWGFNEEGEVTPDGEFGIRYGSAKDITKALRLEAELQKSFRIKERINFQGLPIAIEQRPGETRRWKTATGEGETTMLYAYGYIEGTLGPDGDEYDCYVGPDPQAPFAFIIHQQDPDTRVYDEDKVLLGFSNPHMAKDAYLIHYDRDAFFGSMTQMPMEEFKAKVVRTVQRGSFEQDGMVKANTPSPAGFSITGDRAVHQGTSGPQLVVAEPTWKNVSVHPRVVITPQELAGEDVRKVQRGPRKHVVRRDVNTYKRLPGVEVVQNIYPFDPRHGPAQRLGIEALAQIPQNRRFLETEIQRRLASVAPNYADPEQDRPEPGFVMDHDYEAELNRRLEVARKIADGPFAKGGDAMAYRMAREAGLTEEEADAYAAAGPGAGDPLEWRARRKRRTPVRRTQ